MIFHAISANFRGVEDSVPDSGGGGDGGGERVLGVGRHQHPGVELSGEEANQGSGRCRDIMSQRKISNKLLIPEKRVNNSFGITKPNSTPISLNMKNFDRYRDRATKS